MLGSTELDPVRYDQVRLKIDRVEVTVQGGIVLTARVPSGRIKIVGGFTLDAGRTPLLTLDFEADKSVVIAGPRNVLVKPVIKLLIRGKDQSLAAAREVGRTEDEPAATPALPTSTTIVPAATAMPTFVLPSPTTVPPTATLTPTATATNTPMPPTPTPTATKTPVPPSPTPTATATNTPMPPTPTPTATNTPMPPTPIPTATNTPMPPTPTPTATPMVITLSPSKDNTLYESADGSVSNGAGEHLFAGKTNSGSIRRALLAFDIAGSVPAGATITDVVLELNMSKSQAGATAVELRRVLADWGEGASDASGNEGPGTAAAPGDATWLHRSLSAAMWQTPGGDFSSNASASGQVADVGTYAWGSTAQLVAAVQSWLDDPSTNFGWVVVGNEAVNQTTKRFSSRETPDEANRPRLTVTFISK